MRSTEEVTEVVSVEDLRGRAMKALSHTWLKIDGELLQIKEALSYTELLEPVTVLVSAFEIHGYMLGPLKKVQADIVSQLSRVEQEHRDSTSLDALRERVLGIVRGEGEPVITVISLTIDHDALDEIVDELLARYAGQPRIARSLAEVKTILRSRCGRN